ncbi:hypothetical protein L7F22_056088 [Adiantum nelumboides]|nr:hypothetical protein [Adiantum nelumboides]
MVVHRMHVRLLDLDMTIWQPDLGMLPDSEKVTRLYVVADVAELPRTTTYLRLPTIVSVVILCRVLYIHDLDTDLTTGLSFPLRLRVVETQQGRVRLVPVPYSSSSGGVSADLGLFMHADCVIYRQANVMNDKIQPMQLSVNRGSTFSTTACPGWSASLDVSSLFLWLTLSKGQTIPAPESDLERGNERELLAPPSPDRLDHGGEYTSHAFKDLCLSAGICHEFSNTDHSQQNGRAEHKNRTLFEAARAMLLQASLPDAYWEEATATACYIKNRIPSTRNPTTTPYTLWHGHPPHLGHLRIFGSIAYPLVTQLLSKLSPRAQRTIFVGYGDHFGIKAYRLYIQDHHKFIFAHTVVFDEEFILSGKSSPPVHTTFSSPPSSVHSSHQSSLAASPTHTPMQNSYPSGHNFEPLLSIGRLSFITHPPPHAHPSHAQPIGNSPTPPLAPIPSQLTPLPTPAATTSITPQTLSTPLSSLPLICRPRSPHSPTITSSPRQTLASSLRRSSFLLHDHSNMERALQTAHKRTNPSPLSPHRKPLPPLLPASPSPSSFFFRNSHVTSPSSPTPIDLNKFESHNSTSTTSPSQHTSTLHSDQAASSSHGRTRSLREIYEATSFSAVLTNENIIEHPQEPLEDALPLSVHDALASSESQEWHAAILDELQALEAANTWELVPPPEHHNIVSCKWLLKKKYHPNGSVDRYKARLVAHGFTQQKGVDYFDMYSPVLVLTIRTIYVDVEYAGAGFSFFRLPPVEPVPTEVLSDPYIILGLQMNMLIAELVLLNSSNNNLLAILFRVQTFLKRASQPRSVVPRLQYHTYNSLIDRMVQVAQTYDQELKLFIAQNQQILGSFLLQQNKAFADKEKDMRSFHSQVVLLRTTELNNTISKMDQLNVQMESERKEMENAKKGKLFGGERELALFTLFAVLGAIASIALVFAIAGAAAPVALGAAAKAVSTAGQLAAGLAKVVKILEGLQAVMEIVALIKALVESLHNFDCMIDTPERPNLPSDE